jgi:flagellar motility protein MotE (MotC chaperone)
MKQFPHPYPEKSLIGQCLALAHATFYDALPANVADKAPTAPATLPSKRAPAGGAFQRFSQALDNWFYRQRMKDREAYLEQAADIFDVERRMRELERRPHY